MKSVVLFILANLITAIVSHALTITAVANGSWTSNSTWSCNCQPGNSDNIIIPAGITVTDSGPAILFLGPVITISISGTLVLNNGSLQVDATDIIKINTGGKITGSGITGGAVYSGVIPIFIANGTSVSGPKTITNGTLPVTLLFFNSLVNDGNVLLTWASASELNFDHYEIEASRDGSDFTSIGTVKGNLNSTRRVDYSFRDNAPVMGKSYYRLKAIDLNGTVSASMLLEANVEILIRKIDVFPNPVYGMEITTRLNFSAETNGTIVMINSCGDTIVHDNVLTGMNEHSLRLTTRPESGTYFIIVTLSGEKFISRIIIP